MAIIRAGVTVFSNFRTERFVDVEESIEGLSAGGKEYPKVSVKLNQDDLIAEVTVREGPGPHEQYIEVLEPTFGNESRTAIPPIADYLPLPRKIVVIAEKIGGLPKQPK